MKAQQGILGHWAEHLSELLNYINPHDPTFLDRDRRYTCRCRYHFKANKLRTRRGCVFRSMIDSVRRRLDQSALFHIFDFTFLPARRYASAGNSDRNVSVCPSVSVRHVPVLCQNEES